MSDPRTAGGTAPAGPPAPNVEAWLGGPVPGVPPSLQPAAHALLQARAELGRALAGLDARQLWVRPGGAAAAGFHALHVAGSTDRLLTYARGEELSAAQRAALEAERAPPELSAEVLLAGVERAVAAALAQLRATDPERMQEPRPVGRARLPSTVGALLFHAAEHAQRHAGQAVTTAKIVRALAGAGEAVDREEAEAIAAAARTLLERAEERMRAQEGELERLRVAADLAAALRGRAAELEDELAAQQALAADLAAQLRREQGTRHYRLAQVYWRLRHLARRLVGRR